MRLAEVRERLGSPVTMALTATATPQVRDDIVRMLKLRSPKLHVTGFDRPNLTYACRRMDTEAQKDAALLNGLSRQLGSGMSTVRLAGWSNNWRHCSQSAFLLARCARITPA